MKTIRLFISSPGDVAQEREICRRVISRLNREFGGRAHLDGYFWEYEPMIITKDYQEQIPPPSSFDIFVCILWSRLGSRLHSKYTLPDGRPCRSGTEFEFVDAIEGRKRTEGTPDIMVWVNKTQPVIPLEPENDYEQRILQWRSLKAFLDEWTRDSDEAVFTGAVNSYRQLDQFEERIEVKLHKLIERRLSNENSEGAAPLVQWTQGSPYLGLQAFDEAHEDVFFGRTAAIESVLQAVRRQAEAGSGFVVILGASGSGKSSLTYAGVLPMLTTPGVIEGIGLWRKASFRPGSDGKEMFANLSKALLDQDALPDLADPETNDPVAELALRLERDPGLVAERVRLVLNEAARQQREEQRQQMRDRAKQFNVENRSEDAEAILKRLQELQAPRARLVLVVDQFEELFTGSASREQRGQLIEVLEALSLSGRVVILATLRSDFYHQCQAFPKLIALAGESGKVDLLPPQAHEIGQIIREPARMAGLQFEKDAATGESLDEVIRDASMAHPDALPLLEHCLDQLYACQVERADRMLRMEDYEKLGRLEGALARHAEQVYSTLDAKAQGDFDPVFRALVTLGRDEAIPVRRTALQAELPGTTLIEKFTAQRLFTTQQNAAGEPTVCVAHEALLREWHRVQDWIAENEDFLAVRARVADAHARWKESSQDPSFLLQAGRQLAEAEEGIAGHEDAFATDERDFVRQSRLRISAAEGVAAKRRRLVLFAMAGLTTLAVIGFILAQQQKRRQEETAKREFQARERAEATLDAGTDFLTDILGPSEWISRLQQKDLELSATFLKASGHFTDRVSAYDPPVLLIFYRSLALAQLANNYYHRGDGDQAVATQKEAIAWQQRLIELEPDNVEAQRNLGLVYFRLGLFHSLNESPLESIQAYRQSLAELESRIQLDTLEIMAPAWLQSKAHLAAKLLVTGSVDEGKLAFQECLAKIEEWKPQTSAISWPSETIKLSLLESEALRRSGQDREAHEVLERTDKNLGLLGDEPASLALVREVAAGWANILVGSEAIEKYEQVLEALPEDDRAMAPINRTLRTEIMQRLIPVQLSESRYEEAHDTAYERAGITQDLRDLDPANVDYGERHYHSLKWLAQASLGLNGRKQEAAEWFDTACEQLIDLLERQEESRFLEALAENASAAIDLYLQLGQDESAFDVLTETNPYLEAMIDAMDRQENPSEQAELKIAFLQARQGVAELGDPGTQESGKAHLQAAKERIERVTGEPAPADLLKLLEDTMP